MNCINFGKIIYLYDWNMKLYGSITVKELLESYKGFCNYDITKQFLDARAKDGKVFLW